MLSSSFLHLCIPSFWRSDSKLWVLCSASAVSSFADLAPVFFFFFAWNRWSLPAPRTPSDWPPSDCQSDEASLKKGLREEVRCCRRLPTPLLSVETSQPVIDMQWRVCALILKSSINTFRKQWACRKYTHTDESGIRFSLGYMALGWKW